MTQHANDIVYAYMKLGLEVGSSFGEIQQVLERAKAYKFSSKDRIHALKQVVEFFKARQKLGDVDASFAEIKKAYHRKAMELHPDRHKGSQKDEDHLKEINAAYALVEEMHRRAKNYYKQPEKIRRLTEHKARAEMDRERGEAASSKAPLPFEGEKPEASSFSPRKYLASYVPRSIRTARLNYLPARVIIGSKATESASDLNFIFDFFMLPEDQFIRAKLYLSVPEAVMPALQLGKFAPPYILQDIKEIKVPENESDPEIFAKDYFKKEFGL